ncbi:MAG: DUF4338 domain-containing protein [Deltaproteobacteria bacterium]|nr:DUF4338 domain-containing protein [Deltaproteobacteria bacterium]
MDDATALSQPRLRPAHSAALGASSLDEVIRFRQTPLGVGDVAWLQEQVDGGLQQLSDVAAAACHRFGWKRAHGGIPLAACSVMLRKLEERGLLQLPRAPQRHQEDTERTRLLDALGTVPGMVECQPEGPFTLRPIAPEERDGFRLHLQRYHYLGFKRSVGESMGYAAFVGQELVALLDWGAAVLRCHPRDEYVGWDDEIRVRHLPLVVGNRRFLILPWIRIPHLASRILGANLRRLSRDWQAAYGHPALLAETFVDVSRFEGTCYRAANWRRLGQTLGETRTCRDGTRPRGCPKDVYVYPLGRDALARLRAPEVA